jgi:FtsP/CotA-like multicopper oxidase with cupredoxin domain
MKGEPGARHAVIDNYYRRQRYELVHLAYGDEAPLRAAPPGPPKQLAANPLAEPDLANEVRHEVLLEGGAMGGMSGAMLGGKHMGIRALVERRKFWAINGQVFGDRPGDPLFILPRGRTCRMVIRNETAFEHPMHLHGHTFRVIARGGKPDERRPWRDTVLVRPRETVEIAFVADNPGDWMFHCHILEHLAAGMMATIRVG